MRLVHRHADEGGAVGVAPGHEAGRLVAAPQPLVRVHELVRDGGDLVGVLEEAGDEVPPGLGELVLRTLLPEGVLIAFEERHVRVHAAAWLVAHRLRHERGVHALLDRDLLDDRAERHDVVGHRERVRVTQVDLVLTRPALVVAVLDRDAQVFQHPHRTSAEVVRRPTRHVVEVSCGVDGNRALGPDHR